MGWLTGFEPATPGTTTRYSNQLSYNHHLLCLALSRWCLGGLGYYRVIEMKRFSGVCQSLLL